MKLLSRLVRVAVALLLLSNKSRVFAMYKVKAIKDRALFGYSFLNLTDRAMDMDRCLAMCLQDCRCMSFQICKDQICQLSSTNKDLSPSVLGKAAGCMNFFFQNDFEKVNNQQCEKGCPIEGSCCTTSNPCQNGGLCEPIMSADHTKPRFRCKCRPGYTGNLCQDPIKSCRGYINGSRVAGKYKVVDADMTLFEVFCDFDTNSTMAWTLIQSYQLQNNEQFKERPFTISFPIHEDTPRWDLYRLSKSRMESIQQDSSKWRMTCRYDTDGLNCTDYVRASNDIINILTQEGGRCKEVEFIDVRGYNCKDCTAKVGQRSSDLRPFHIESYFSYTNENCSFKPKDALACGEDNFGFYRCINPAHRCSSSPTSTSQTWFGRN